MQFSCVSCTAARLTVAANVSAHSDQQASTSHTQLTVTSRLCHSHALHLSAFNVIIIIIIVIVITLHHHQHLMQT